MQVPLFDLRQQHEPLRDELRAAVERVFESHHFVLGPEAQALEAELARYCQTQHAVGCGSGSDALLLALMALDVKAGAEVITTPHTFFATAGAVARLGARPVFVDIEPRTYNINPALIEAAITEATRAILPVPLHGQCAGLDAALHLPPRHHPPVIGDGGVGLCLES